MRALRGPGHRVHDRQGPAQGHALSPTAPLQGSQASVRLSLTPLFSSRLIPALTLFTPVQTGPLGHHLSRERRTVERLDHTPTRRSLALSHQQCRGSIPTPAFWSTSRGNDALHVLKCRVNFYNWSQKAVDNNFYGFLTVCDVLMPIIVPGGCVVNVTGSLGTLDQVTPEYRTVLADPQCTIEAVSQFMNKYVEAAQTEKHIEAGFSHSITGMFKLGQIVAGRAHARQLRQRQVRDHSQYLNGKLKMYVSKNKTSFVRYLL